MTAPSENMGSTAWLQDTVIIGDPDLTEEMRRTFQALTNEGIVFAWEEVIRGNDCAWELTWEMEQSQATFGLTVAQAPELLLDPAHGARIPVLSFYYQAMLAGRPVSATVIRDGNGHLRYSYAKIEKGYQSLEGNVARGEMISLLPHVRPLAGEERVAFQERLDQIPTPDRA